MRVHRSSTGRWWSTGTAARAAAAVVALTAALLLTSFPRFAETTSASAAVDRKCILPKRFPSDSSPAVCKTPVEPNVNATPDQDKPVERDPSAPCDTYKVQPRDGCEAIAAKYNATKDLLTEWNAKRTWGWEGCNELKAQQVICVTNGVPPRPEVSPTAECGAQTVGNKTCPNGACCSRWGYCGTTDEHCKVDHSGNVGVSCQSQCTPPPTVFDPAFKVCDEHTMARRVVYYEGWGGARKCNPVHAKDLDPTIFTDLHFAFAEISEDFRIEIPHNESLQLNDVKALKQKNPDLRIAISVGGWAFNDPPPNGTVLPKGTTRKCDRFSNMTSTPERRAAFAESVYEFLKHYNFDGIDVDWEFPAAVDRCGTKEDTQNYVELVKVLRERLDSEQTVSIAISGGDWYMQGTDLRKMEPYLDYIVVMSYDLAGQWDFEHGDAKVSAHTDLRKVTAAVDRLPQFGIYSNKILMGVAAYGRPFILADPKCTAPGCKFVKGPVPVSSVCTIDPSTLTYKEVLEVQRTLTTSYSVTQDNDAAVKVMAYDDNKYWVTYDDHATLPAKVNAGFERCLAGYSLWAVDHDLPYFPLTKALYEAVDKRKKKDHGNEGKILDLNQKDGEYEGEGEEADAEVKDEERRE